MATSCRNIGQNHAAIVAAQKPAIGNARMLDPARIAGNRVGAARRIHRRLGFERLLVEDGIILRKYWFSVSDAEQERRFKSRLHDPMRQWKLSPMDLKSYDRWDDYTKARDEMFAATDTAWAPWFVARSEDKKRVRLNVISHLLEHIPHKTVPTKKVKLPKRKIGRYKATEHPFRYVPERF